jgi:hypothetical protein
MRITIEHEEHERVRVGRATSGSVRVVGRLGDGAFLCDLRARVGPVHSGSLTTKVTVKVAKVSG